MSQLFPQANHVECWLVGAMLAGQDRTGSSLADDIGELKAIDFSDDRHRQIVRTIFDLRGRGEDCGAAAVAADLERQGKLAEATGGRNVAFLVQLMEETPSVWRIAEWVRLVRDASVQREMVLIAETLVARLYDPTADPALLADDAERVAKLIRTRSRARSQSQLHLTRVADVEPESVAWLWPNRIPLGKMTLLCGDPGLGKSHLMTDIAARVTRGDRWPDDPTRCKIGSVILFSAEDDIADTIRPRLDRAGADVSKVHVLESVLAAHPRTGIMERQAFSLGEHLPALERCLQTIGDVRLIVIDPVSSYTGRVDSHKNAEVRTLLGPLADLAQRYKVAVVAVTHLSKGAGGKAVYRATGSLAFAAAARGVWMLGRDLGDPERRLLLPVKCNVAKELTGMAFTIVDDGVGSRVAWEAEPVPMTGDEYLVAEMQSHAKGTDDDETALGIAIDFVKEQLSAGPLLSTELAAGASANQIRAKTLERARNNLGCKARKRGDGKWEVHLPRHEQRQPHLCGEVDDVGVVDELKPAKPKRKRKTMSTQDRQGRQRRQENQGHQAGRGANMC